MLTAPLTRACTFAALCVLAFTTPALADPGRTLVWEVTVDAPVERVWELFTTEPGIEAWMVPDATVDFRMGGSIITAYEGEATLDNPKCIVQRVLSFEPMRMISMQVERAPEGFPFADVVTQAWGVTTFREVAPGRTHIHMASVGWQEGEAWEQAEEFFQTGNAWTLQQLEQLLAREQQRQGDEPATSLDALDTMQWLVGGEWIHESKTPEGGLFRVRNIIEQGPDGESLTGRGWLGDADGMWLHSETQVWREPVTGAVRFQNINENGAVARGEITANDERTVVWDWNMTERDGRAARFHVLMRRTGEDAYRFILNRYLPDGERREMVNIVYERVAEAPAAFEEEEAAEGRSD
jgi:uncharacterized protein YndB with AHSA1/START domain